MKLVHVSRVCFVVAAVLVVGVFGAAEEKKSGSADSKPDASKTSKTPESGSKKVDEKGSEPQVSKPLPNIPEDLTGKSNAEIMSYINLLVTERKRLQKHLSYNVALTLLTTTFTFAFHTNYLVLPFMAILHKTNDSYRGTLHADWAVHQDQMASFLCEYTRVKKIDVQKLPKSKATGKPLIRVEFAPGKFVKLPIWKESKETPLPSQANIHHTTDMLRNWWTGK